MNPRLRDIPNEAIEQERDRRKEMWSQLLQGGGTTTVPPKLLRNLGIYGGAQGIWVDKVRTGRLTPTGEGVTVGVLHNGQSYADDLADDCIIYHYPKTRRPTGRDRAEVNATKAAGHLGLPFFVVTYPTPNAATRDVRLGWVEAWHDESSTFLVSFEERPPVTHAAIARGGQQRFKFRVLQRYGPRCVACGLDVLGLLDAAHLCPKKAKGTDNPRNGLVLCATHHRAFDLGFIAIEPETLRILCRETGPDAERLGVLHHSLDHLEKKPHADALRWAWNHRQTCTERSRHV